MKFQSPRAILRRCRNEIGLVWWGLGASRAWKSVQNTHTCSAERMSKGQIVEGEDVYLQKLQLFAGAVYFDPLFAAWKQYTHFLSDESSNFYIVHIKTSIWCREMERSFNCALFDAPSHGAILRFKFFFYASVFALYRVHLIQQPTIYI